MATIIDLNSITDGTLVNNEWVGTGAFDILMKAVNGNIEMQYQKGRLTGNDYAQVYLGGLQAVLQQAVNYAMNVGNSQAQADLTYEQVKGAYTDRVLKDKEAAKLGLDNVMKNAEAERLGNPNAVYTPKYGV